MSETPTVIAIKLLQKQHTLEVQFSDASVFVFSAEYLRVFSPSAEVRGHGQQEMNLVTGKQNVNIIGVDPVGNYAIKLIFDDGHASGIYNWEELYRLGVNAEKNWQEYLKKF